MSWAISWLTVIAAYLFVLTLLLPTAAELCMLEGGRWLDHGNGLTACIG